MIEIEEFRDIPGYEGLYEVSNLGRVRRNGRIIKPAKDRYGYLFVGLSKNGKRKLVNIHRLVASSFLSNPQNLPCVNHKDEDKTNNTAENLEYCDVRYNINYGTGIQRSAKSRQKPVLQFDLNGNLIKEWPSMIKVEEETGIAHNSISACCQGKRNSAGGYLWRFKN